MTSLALDPSPVSDLILNDTELLAITGYRRSSEQLAELHRRGFARAYRNRLGRVTLERAHYNAVCANHLQVTRPKVRLLGGR